MRYKPKVGLVTNQVAVGISYTFGFSDKGLIEANTNGSLAYKNLQQKRDAKMLMLRRSLCSTLLCDNSKRQIYAQDLNYVKKNRSMVNSFLDLSNYNLNLVMKKNNKDGKNMAKSLIDAKSIQSYFINSRGFAKNKIKII